MLSENKRKKKVNRLLKVLTDYQFELLERAMW